MEAFKVRKYGNPSAYLGSVTTNFTGVQPFDRKFMRLGTYILAALCITNATRDFSFFYEVFFHLRAPVSHTHYESSVPK